MNTHLEYPILIGKPKLTVTRMCSTIYSLESELSL